MKIIINESQLRLIVENEEKKGDNLMDFTKYVNADLSEWDDMFEHLNKKKGGKYDGYYIDSYVNLSYSDVTELEYLVKVKGCLYLNDTQIESLPMLSYVGGFLDLGNTPLSKTTTEKELRNKIEVKGIIYL